MGTASGLHPAPLPGPCQGSVSKFRSFHRLRFVSSASNLSSRLLNTESRGILSRIYCTTRSPGWLCKTTLPGPLRVTRNNLLPPRRALAKLSRVISYDTEGEKPSKQPPDTFITSSGPRSSSVNTPPAQKGVSTQGGCERTSEMHKGVSPVGGGKGRGRGKERIRGYNFAVLLAFITEKGYLLRGTLLRSP